MTSGRCWPSAADEEWYSSKRPSSTVAVNSSELNTKVSAFPAETTSTAVEYGVMKSNDIVQFTIRNVDKAHCIYIQYICLLDHLSALHGTVLTQGTIPNNHTEDGQLFTGTGPLS